jgi:hypothetical protein
MPDSRSSIDRLISEDHTSPLMDNLLGPDVADILRIRKSNLDLSRTPPATGATHLASLSGAPAATVSPSPVGQPDVIVSPPGTSISPDSQEWSGVPTTSTNAPLSTPNTASTGPFRSDVEGAGVNSMTQSLAATLAKAPQRAYSGNEANSLSKTAPTKIIPDEDGNYHVNGQTLTSMDLMNQYPDVYKKIMEARGGAPGEVTADKRNIVQRGLDQFYSEDPVGKNLAAMRAGYNGEEFQPSGLMSERRSQETAYGTGRDISEIDRDTPKSAILAIPGGLFHAVSKVVQDTAATVGDVAQVHSSKNAIDLDAVLKSGDQKAIDEAFRNWVNPGADSNETGPTSDDALKAIPLAQKIAALQKVRDGYNESAELGRYIAEANRRTSVQMEEDIDRFMHVDNGNPGARLVKGVGELAGGITQLAVLSAIPTVGPSLAYAYMVGDGYAKGVLHARANGFGEDESRAMGTIQAAVSGSVLAAAHLLPGAPTGSLASDVSQKVIRGIGMGVMNTGGDIIAQKAMFDHINWEGVPEKLKDEVMGMVEFELGNGVAHMAKDMKLRQAVSEYESPTGTGARALVRDRETAIQRWYGVLSNTSATPGMRMVAAKQIALLLSGKGVNITPRSSQADIDKGVEQVRSEKLGEALAKGEDPKVVMDQMRTLQLARVMAEDGYGDIKIGPYTTVKDLAEGRTRGPLKRVAPTEPEAQPAVEPTRSENREGIAAPEEPVVQPAPGTTGDTRTALQQAEAKARASKGISSVQTVTTHPNAQITGAWGEGNRVEGITDHTNATAMTTAHRALANTMYSIMAGAAKANGIELGESEHKTIKNIVDAINAPNGVTKVAERWQKQMGVPQPVVDALLQAAQTVKAERGIDMNRAPLNRDTTRLPHDQMATRGMVFLEEFHKQLAENVNNMGVEAPDWLRATVAKTGKLIAPGGKYDTAYRRGMGLPERSAEPTHVPTAPIVKPVSIGELNRAATQTGEPNGQAGEGPTSSEAQAAQEAPGGAERGAVQEGAGEGAAERPGSDEAGRGPSSVLGTNTGAPPAAEPGTRPGDETPGSANTGAVQQSGTPEVADPRAVSVALARTLAWLDSESGEEGGVKSLHAQVMEDDKWDSYDPYGPEMAVDEHGNDIHESLPSFMTYGREVMLYPVPASSPFTHVMNMTIGAIYPAEVVSHLLTTVDENGKEVPGVKQDMPGNRLLKAMSQVHGREGAMQFITGLGFDAIAAEVTQGKVAFVDAKGKLHDMDADGDTKPAPSLPGEPERLVNPPPTEKPLTGEYPKFNPRTGESELYIAQQKGVAALTDMLGRRNVWGRMHDGTFGYLSNRLNVAEGTEAPGREKAKAPVPAKEEPIQHAQPIEDKVTRDQHVEDALQLYENSHFKSEDILTAARKAGVPIGDAEIKASGIQGLTDKEVEAIMAQASREQGTSDRSGKQPASEAVSTDKTYRAESFMDYIKAGGLAHIVEQLARNEQFMAAMDGKSKLSPLEVIVKAAAEDESKRASVEGLQRSITGELDSKHMQIARAAAEAGERFIPSFFSSDPKYIADMKMREKANAKLPKLSDYFEPRAEKQDSFSPTLDVHENTERAFDEKTGANFVAPEQEEERRRLASKEPLEKAVRLTAERGGFTPEALNELGIKAPARAQHAQSYHDLVDRVMALPEVVGRLLHLGLSNFLSIGKMNNEGLVKNGYAGLMLAHLGGMGKKPFNVDAYKSDPGFKDHYTVGEETVLMLNSSGMEYTPLPDGIMTRNELNILLDHNHPLYDQMVERVNSRLTSDHQIMLAGTPMSRVFVKNAKGERSSILVPTKTLLGEYRIKSISNPSKGREPEASGRGVVRGNRYGELRVQYTKDVERRLSEALESLNHGDEQWATKLGESLMKQLATANTAIDQMKQLPPSKSTKSALQKLQKFADDTKSRLDNSHATEQAAIQDRARLLKANVDQLQRDLELSKDERVRTEAQIKLMALEKLEQTPAARMIGSTDQEAMEARAEADRAVWMAEQDNATTNIPWDGIFTGDNDTGVASTTPAIVAATAIRNKEQFMAVAEELFGDDPARKFAMDAFDKIHPMFFTELGTNIDMDPEFARAHFDKLGRLIKVGNSLKATMTSSQLARTMAHELGHAMETFMGLRAHEVSDKWYKGQLELFRQKNPRFADVMDLDTVHFAPLDFEQPNIPVSEAFSDRGTGSVVMITPQHASEIVSKYPDMAPHLKPIVDEETGEPVGSILSKAFAGSKGYRFLSHAEFIAETFLDRMIQYAHGKRSASVLMPGQESRGSMSVRGGRMVSLDDNPGAKSVVDAIHRNMGLLTDAMVGKNTMRRYVGYLVNQGGGLDRGVSSGSKDVAFPDFRMNEDNKLITDGRRLVQEGPTWKMKAATPQSIAERDHLMAERIGRKVNIVRAALMKQLHATSVNDLSRSAGYGMRGVLGDLGVSYNTMASQLYSHYDAAHKATLVDGDTRRWLVNAAEGSQEAKVARDSRMSKAIVITAPDGKDYAVNIGMDGKFDDVTPMDNIRNMASRERTGDYVGDMKGLGASSQHIHDIVWNRMRAAIANLSDKLGVNPDDLADFEEQVKKVPNYYAHQLRARTEFDPAQVGVKNPMPTDAGVGMYNVGMNPEVDYGINAKMLLERKYKTMEEAVVKGGFFPVHTNAVENDVSSIANALGVIARLDALTNLMDRGLAVPGYDGGAATRSWDTMKMSTTGLTDEMFGKALADIRVHPDAERVLRYAFKPDPLARTAPGRYMAVLGGILNTTQLYGLNDYVNGMAAVSGFGGAEAKSKYDLSKTGKKFLYRGAAAAGGLAAFAAGVPVVGGVAVGALTAVGLTALISKMRPMAAGTITAVSEGRKGMGIIQSLDALHPERLPKEAQEFLAFAQAANIKLMENPIQIERMRKMVTELNRQGKFVQSGLYWVANLLNKPTMYNDIGWGGKTFSDINKPGLGGGPSGKALAKLGMLKMLAPAIMDKYRDSNGNVDWTNDKLRAECRNLSDDMDNQVGAIQYRNLHMNPTIVSYMKTAFRAFGFRYTTEKMKTLVAADIINNVGTRGPWADSYKAFRSAATGGGTDRPESVGNDWRKGTLAMGTLFMTAAMFARMEAMVSHTLWHGSNYTQSDFARRTYEQLSPVVGKKSAAAFEGMLSIVPPEDSSLYEALRHVAANLVSPQFGHNDPSTGMPKNVTVPGTMYARNLWTHPVAPSLNPNDQLAAAKDWVMSGMNPAVSIPYDIARGHDNIGNPIGWGAPFRNIQGFRQYNDWTEHKAGDTWQVPVKGLAKGVAYSISSMNPLWVRDLDQLFPTGGQPAGGNWSTAAMQMVGGRAMPPTTGMSAAERYLYEHQREYTGDRTTSTALQSRLLIKAKTQMSETGDTSELDRLGSEGAVEEKKISQAKSDYLDQSGEPRKPIIRFLRRVSDADKGHVKEAYTLATEKEKEMIKDYLADPIKRTKLSQEKVDEVLEWIEDWDKNESLAHKGFRKIW